MKEGRNLTAVVDDVPVTSIVMPARPGSCRAAVGTMAVVMKLFWLFLLSSLFSLDTRIDSKLKRDENAKSEAESSGCVSSLTS